HAFGRHPVPELEVLGMFGLRTVGVFQKELAPPDQRRVTDRIDEEQQKPQDRIAELKPRTSRQRLTVDPYVSEIRRYQAGVWERGEVAHLLLDAFRLRHVVGVDACDE